MARKEDPEKEKLKLKKTFSSIGEKLNEITTDSEVVGLVTNKNLDKEMLYHKSFLDTTDRADDPTKKLITHISNYSNTLDIDTVYARVEKALQNPEIDGTMNIHADEITTQDSEGNIYNVFCSDKECKMIIENLIDRIGLPDKSFSINKNTCSYGNEMYEILYQKDNEGIHSINWIPREMVGRHEENGILKHFYPRDSKKYTTQNKYDLRPSFFGKKENKKTIEPWRILHWRINVDKHAPYGTSDFYSVIGIIEELRLLQLSLNVARITRSPERRIFEIQVGNAKGELAMQRAREVVKGLKKKNILDLYQNNEVSAETDFFSAYEDIVLPRRAGDEAHRIDTLPQFQATDTSDLEFIRDRLFPGLGVSRQYLYDDTFANANVNLSNKDVKFAKKIRRRQKAHLTQVYKLAIIELTLKGKDPKKYKDLLITMNNPSNLDERERIAIETERWNLATTIKSVANTEGVSVIPDYIILRDYLGKDESEILEILMQTQIQKSNGNPFTIVPQEERPKGWEDLDQLLPKEEGGELEAGEEGAEDLDQDQIPDAVEGALGEAPGGEAGGAGEGGEEGLLSADANVTNNKSKAFMEQALKRKNEILERRRKIMEEKKKQLEKELFDRKYTKTNMNIEFMESSGEINIDAIKRFKKNNKEIYI